MKMVKFLDIENDKELGGILLPDGSGNYICGCCGCVIEKDNEYFKVLEIMPWISISDEIISE